MLRITVLCQERFPSQSAFARASGLNQATIHATLKGRLKPYDSQLLKMARALRWNGDPAALLEDVPNEVGCNS